jgi:OOP family OmpA-OmpF porin
VTRSLSKTLAALSLALGAIAGAHAEGAYVGGDLSKPDFSSAINGAGGDGGGRSVGGKLYGGYQFTPNFAVEGGYFNLGRSKDINGIAKGEGLYVDGVGSLRLAPQWSAYGSLGVAEARLKTPTGNDSSPALKLGLGVQYDLSKDVALRLGYDRYHFTNAFDDKPNVGEAAFGVRVAF